MLKLKNFLKEDSILRDRKVWAWTLYDWANSAYAATVMAVFFPVFFKSYWSAGVEATESTFNLGLGNSLAAFLVAISAPILGALADRGRKRKGFLFVFMIIGVAATAGFFWVPKGDWPLALALLVLSLVGFSGANIFYDSLLVHITSKNKFDIVSGLGFAMGYLGGGILLVVNVLMTLKPELFGIADKAAAVQWAFLSVGVWWLVFSIPLFLWVSEPEKKEPTSKHWLKDGIHSFFETLKHIKQYKNLFIFLIAYLFYIDGVNTIVKMAVDFGMAIGLKTDDMIKAIMLVQFVGFPAAIFFGWLGGKIGAKKGIFICLGVYTVSTILGALITKSWHFFAMACMIGLVQGGIQSLSRSYYSQMVPKESSSEFFGFFNTLGKFSAIVGPILVGLVSSTTGSPRASILVILTFFMIGGFLLTKVKFEPHHEV